MKDAAYYDEIYRGQPIVDEKRVQFVSELCRGSVLDIGCGDGRLAGYHTGSYFGLDFSPVAIDLAGRLHPESVFAVWDFLNGPLPVGDVKWDTIVLGELLEHLDDEAEATLFEKVKHVLAPDGSLIVTTPNGDSVPDPSHVRSFARHGLTDKLQPFGEVCEHNYSDLYVIASAHPAGRPKLSAVLIVKNEEELLARCLESLKDIYDELVIVDTGSTDTTEEIAHSFGARMGRFPWIDDFAAARTYAESLCFGQYVYWQDGDEILIEGHDRIKEIVAEGKLDGVAPMMIYSRDGSGATKSTFLRQELLHKNNGLWEWVGAAHNWLNGPCRTVEQGILVEHLDRPSGDRPNHKDIFEALRANLKGKGQIERGLFYLAREHYYRHHWHEVIALLRLLLDTEPNWPAQRARACVLLGNSWLSIGNQAEAASAYMRGIQEFPTTAEPYFQLGELRYKQGKYQEAATWLLASTIHVPSEFFIDMSIYDWRRYDRLALTLYKLGALDEARYWGQKALDGYPSSERLKTNMTYYEGS